MRGYAGRKHFVLISPETERTLGMSTYESIIREYRHQILPPTDPVRPLAQGSGIAPSSSAPN